MNVERAIKEIAELAQFFSRLVGLHAQCPNLIPPTEGTNKNICPMPLLHLTKQIEKLNMSVLLIEGGWLLLL